jgi:hypothetical protein
MRINHGQEFVVGGYTPSAKNFDALVISYYEDRKLMYAARTRNGFTPASRENRTSGWLTRPRSEVGAMLARSCNGTLIAVYILGRGASARCAGSGIQSGVGDDTDS